MSHAITNGAYRPLIEVDADKYSDRLKYYEQLRAGALQTWPASEIELRLLKQHPNYVPPTLEACVELAC